MSLQSLLESSKLISQGAEAKVYKGFLISPSSQAVLFKYRFPKKYRHPALSAQLTRARISSEARALARCVRNGVRVPDVRVVDLDSGIIVMEWIEGNSVRHLLGSDEEEKDEKVLEAENSHSLESFGLTEDKLMSMIGQALGKMHKADIIHSDLTTSNMMVHLEAGNPELVLIDFGLSFQSTLVEDKAVDLYVLERAFSSTHPSSEPLFEAVLNSYAEELGSKGWKIVKKRLDEVRLRGRKRSMVG